MASLYLLEVSPLLNPDLRARAEQMLSEERNRKTDKISHEPGKALSLGAGLLLDYVLRGRGLREKEVTILKGDHGKPQIKELPDLYFNLSHSGSVTVIAVADREVGVDIQKEREIGPALRSRIEAPGEWEKMKSVSPNDEALEVRLWTRKEALLKELGEGIAVSFAQHNTFEDENRVTEFDLSELGMTGYYLAVSSLDRSIGNTKPVILPIEDLLGE